MTHVIDRVEPCENSSNGSDLFFVVDKSFQASGVSQLLLDFLRAGQVVMNGWRFDGQRSLHHESCIPLFVRRILVRRISATKVNDSHLKLTNQSSVSTLFSWLTSFPSIQRRF